MVLFGSPDVQRPDELMSADSLEIGPRGQLVAASDLSDYYTLEDLQAVAAPWTALHGLGSFVAAREKKPRNAPTQHNRNR